MRLRGRVLARATIAVVAVVVGWLLGVVPVLPAAWQSRAPIVALVVVFIVYVTAEYEHGLASRRDAPAYRDHVGRLQAFAAQARQLVGRRGQGIAFPIEMTSPMASAFQQHFPRESALIVAWNNATDGYQNKATALIAATNAEQARLRLGPSNGWTSILQAIIYGQLAPNELTWAVQNDHIVAIRDSYWDVTGLPGSPEVTERLLLDLWDSSTEIVRQPAVVEWIDANRRIDQLVLPVRDALASIEVNDDPRGQCNLCPR